MIEQQKYSEKDSSQYRRDVKEMFRQLFGEQALLKYQFEGCFETCYQFIETENHKKYISLLTSLIAEIKVIVSRLFNEHIRKSEEIFQQEHGFE